ncbi:MAG: endonuclease domain-containing protein, partial [Burkholderiales bacterium]|nr:endonuclease domain-containing protein [Burkholderiales bacterium]
MQNRLAPAAKCLPASQTDAETRLWRELRAHRFAGLKFKRREPLGAYIVDFVCYAAKVVIEVDGGQHVDSVPDVERDKWLTSQGFRVLRFWNNQVLGQTEAALARIFEVVSKLPPSPLPLSHQGRGALTSDNGPTATSLS